MEKYDVIPEPEDAPKRGNFPRIGDSKYRFNVWYKFPKPVEKEADSDGITTRLENWSGDCNFKSDHLIDYMRESMSGIKLIEDFDTKERMFLSDDLERCSYRIQAFIPERECGVDTVYAQEDMKSFDEIDYKKSGEWIAKMLDDLGAEVDIERTIDQIKRNREEAKSLIDLNGELLDIIQESFTKEKRT